jgi:hypothetical protein
MYTRSNEKKLALEHKRKPCTRSYNQCFLDDREKQRGLYGKRLANLKCQTVRFLDQDKKSHRSETHNLRRRYRQKLQH